MSWFKKHPKRRQVVEITPFDYETFWVVKENLHGREEMMYVGKHVWTNMVTEETTKYKTKEDAMKAAGIFLLESVVADKTFG